MTGSLEVKLKKGHRRPLSSQVTMFLVILHETFKKGTFEEADTNSKKEVIIPYTRPPGSDRNEEADLTIQRKKF